MTRSVPDRYNGRHIFEAAGLVEPFEDERPDLVSSAERLQAASVWGAGVDIGESDPAMLFLRRLAVCAERASQLAVGFRADDGSLLMPHQDAAGLVVGVTRIRLDIAGREVSREHHARCDFAPVRLPRRVDAVDSLAGYTLLAATPEEGIAAWAAAGIAVRFGTGAEGNGRFALWVDERAVFPGLAPMPVSEHFIIDTPNNYVIQLLDSDMPNSLTYDKAELSEEIVIDSDREASIVRAQLHRGMAAVASTVLGVRTGRNTLLASNASAHKLFDQALGARDLPVGCLPEVATAHYKAVAGMNSWAGFNVTALGGHRKPIAKLEDDAMALTGRAIARQADWESMDKERFVRLPDGTRVVMPCRVKTHSSEMVHLLNWLEDIGEKVQVLGRTRALREALSEWITVQLILDSTMAFHSVDGFVSLYGMRDIPAWALTRRRNRDNPQGLATGVDGLELVKVRGELGAVYGLLDAERRENAALRRDLAEANRDRKKANR